MLDAQYRVVSSVWEARGWQAEAGRDAVEPAAMLESLDPDRRQVLDLLSEDRWPNRHRVVLQMVNKMISSYNFQ